MYHDKQNTDDDARTVTLSGQELRDAVRLLARLAPEEKTPALERLLLVERATQANSLGSEPIDRFALVSLARGIFQDRRRRSNFLESDLFGEPAWDMLLALYVNHISGERLTVSRLVRFAGAADTTALRWLARLEEGGLVARENHPNDARCVLIRLTDDARLALDKYLSETLRHRT